VRFYPLWGSSRSERHLYELHIRRVVCGNFSHEHRVCFNIDGVRPIPACMLRFVDNLIRGLIREPQAVFYRDNTSFVAGIGKRKEEDAFSH